MTTKNLSETNVVKTQGELHWPQRKESRGYDKPLYSNFKKGESDELQSLIKGLSQNVASIGIDGQPTVCFRCAKYIVADAIRLNDKTCHPWCLACFYCGDLLNKENYKIKGDVVYCKKHYADFFGVKCHFCNESIQTNAIVAMGKTWHCDHFLCEKCSKPLQSEDGHQLKYFIANDKVYCQKDYEQYFASKCISCRQSILENKISQLGGDWHESCFVCLDCQNPFQNRVFYEIDHKPYCKYHFHLRRGTLCQECQEPITGSCIKAHNHTYHPQHFNCQFCQRPLRKRFKLHEEKPYCPECHLKLFG